MAILVMIAVNMDVNYAVKRSAQGVLKNTNVKIVIKYYAQSAMIRRVRGLCIAMNAMCHAATIVDGEDFNRGDRVAQNASEEWPLYLRMRVNDCMKIMNS